MYKIASGVQVIEVKGVPLCHQDIAITISDFARLLPATANNFVTTPRILARENCYHAPCHLKCHPHILATKHYLVHESLGTKSQSLPQSAVPCNIDSR
jgi:hypothetical protein